jgi:hypothetical protein
MHRRGMHTESWWESQKEIDLQGNLDAGEKIIIKWMFEKQNEWIVTSGRLL